MEIKGKAYRFGDNINTDFIISGRYKFSITDMNELAKHVMEDIRPGFYDELDHGNSILVAGENFGMGSSREQAPLALKYAGINAIVAKSFARIFFRNAFNIGLPLIEVDIDQINEGDILYIDLDKGILENQTHNWQKPIAPLPPVMQRILQEGGMIEFFAKHKKLEL